ncbi:MAG: nucleotidyltransferase [Candidatus Omnitrophica bacterium]|nr:nucleotidyltransferase [Candidatus Omnitrophota bacterium]MCM8829509.1 nucleotidyltransferase [Candidatus Omnitrophota bacterium]
MRETIKVINKMVKEGLFNDYAIGGGIATMFYIEPFLTYDIDIFLLLEHWKGNVVLLTPVYDYLKEAGYKWKGEHIIVEGVPVQFIPADELEKEAIKNARRIVYEGVKTKIIGPEYLIAILLRAGRKKDIEKIEKILDEVKIDKKILNDILTRYGLDESFRAFLKK